MTTTSTTSALSRTASVILACAAAALVACPALARLSEPSNILFGEARGPNGSVLTAGTVVVSVNGHECAREDILRQLADGVNYAVRVPLDDGMDLRYIPTAAREGEQMDVVIVCDGDEYDVDGAIPAVAAAGATPRADIQALPEPVACVVLLLALAAARRTR